MEETEEIVEESFDGIGQKWLVLFCASNEENGIILFDIQQENNGNRI